MKTLPDVSVSRPATRCIKRALAGAARAHDGGELVCVEVDGDTASSAVTAVSPLP